MTVVEYYILAYGSCRCVGGHSGGGGFPADCVKGQALAETRGAVTGGGTAPLPYEDLPSGSLSTFPTCLCKSGAPGHGVGDDGCDAITGGTPGAGEALVNCVHGRPSGAFCPHCTGNSTAATPVAQRIVIKTDRNLATVEDVKRWEASGLCRFCGKDELCWEGLCTDCARTHAATTYSATARAALEKLILDRTAEAVAQLRPAREMAEAILSSMGIEMCTDGKHYRACGIIADLIEGDRRGKP